MHKAAIIGAGKLGSSLGLYFFDKDYINLEGYYSRSKKSADYSAQLTNTKSFSNIEQIVDNCNIIFITTTDDQIINVWDQLKEYKLKNKIICHCSGSLNSEIFSKKDKDFYSLSMHPMLAVSSKENSYKDLDKAFFTLEGDKEALKVISTKLISLGNPYKIIDTGDKSGYHLSTVSISNMVVGLSYMASKILKTYGFTSKESLEALENLAKKNMDNLFANGPIDALTGPVERADTKTIRSHIKYLDKEELCNEKDIYLNLSLLLLELAKKKNSKRNYDDLECELKTHIGGKN